MADAESTPAAEYSSSATESATATADAAAATPGPHRAIEGGGGIVRPPTHGDGRIGDEVDAARGGGMGPG